MENNKITWKKKIKQSTSEVSNKMALNMRSSFLLLPFFFIPAPYSPPSSTAAAAVGITLENTMPWFSPTATCVKPGSFNSSVQPPTELTDPSLFKARSGVPGGLVQHKKKFLLAWQLFLSLLVMKLVVVFEFITWDCTCGGCERRLILFVGGEYLGGKIWEKEGCSWGWRFRFLGRSVQN